jgi:hypothetical protein
MESANSISGGARLLPIQQPLNEQQRCRLPIQHCLNRNTTAELVGGDQAADRRIVCAILIDELVEDRLSLTETDRPAKRWRMLLKNNRPIKPFHQEISISSRQWCEPNWFAKEVRRPDGPKGKEMVNCGNRLFAQSGRHR